VIQVRNPDGGVSGPLSTIRLLGPVITKAKAKRKGATITVNVTGENFLPEATIVVRSTAGDVVPVQSVDRVKPGKFRVRITRGTVPKGSFILITVENPGPVSSDAASVRVP
jgi:hypothetical protein